MDAGWMAWLRNKARELKKHTLTLYFALSHPDVPLVAKLVALLTVAYALSPIDIIPDFIPVLGILDDLVIVPLGVWLAMALIPHDVFAQVAASAEDRLAGNISPWYGRSASTVVLAVWVLAGYWGWTQIRSVVLGDPNLA